MFESLARNGRLHLEIFKMLFNHVVLPEGAAHSLAEQKWLFTQFDNGNNGGLTRN